MQSMRISLILLVLSGTMISSNRVTAMQEANDTCTEMLIGMISGAGIDLETSAPALACRLDSGRRWFMPKIRDISDSTSMIELDSRGKALLGQVDRFSTDQALVSSLIFLRNDGTVLTQGPGGRTKPTDVSSYDVGGGPSWLHNFQKLYNDSAIRYLQSDVNSVFTGYAWWYMNRRDASLWSITRNMDPLSGNAFLANWGFQQFPWPWQLADQAAIAEYFGASVAELGKYFDVTRPRPSPSAVAAEQTGVTVWGRIEVITYYAEGTGCRSQYFYGGLPLSLYDANGLQLSSTTLGHGDVAESTLSRGSRVCALPFRFQNVPGKSAYILASNLNSPGGWQIATLTGLAPDANGNYQVTVKIP